MFLSIFDTEYGMEWNGMKLKILRLKVKVTLKVSCI